MKKLARNFEGFVVIFNDFYATILTNFGGF